MLIERKNPSATFHMEDIQPSLMAEIESREGEGVMIISQSDVTLQHDGEFQLAPGGESTFQPLELPRTIRHLRNQHMHPCIVTGSRLGQASLDIHQTIEDDRLVITLVNNHATHTYTFGEQLDIGKLVARGRPLRGRELEQTLEAEMYVAPEGMRVCNEQGQIEIPITKYFISEPDVQTIAMDNLPRAHDRRRLHETLRMREATLDEVVAAQHHGHYLSATDPIGFSRNSALWVTGGRALTQDPADQSHPHVDHCEARLCQGGDNPWRIMNETYAPIDTMYAAFFHAVTV